MKPQYQSENISIWEWPGPGMEICMGINSVEIRSPKDAEALIDSAKRFLEACKPQQD